MGAELIIFDFDGTIINSERGIFNSVRYALKSIDIEEPDDDKIRRFIGPPLMASFMKYYGIDEKTAKNLVDVYRERYRPIGYRECELYEGILDMIEALRNKGVKTAVASTKPEEFVVKIVEELGFGHLFDILVGANLKDTQSDKTRLLQKAIDGLGNPAKIEAKNIVMVGDSKYDILAAKNIGAIAVGVEYGFGFRQDFEDAGADHIVKDVKELGNLLMGLLNNA